MEQWSDWKPFPDPRECGYLVAPLGPGVYELRHRRSGDLILYGCGKNLAYRMSSLLPQPYGEGTRNNAKKRSYVLEHIEDIEYRTRACDSKEQAEQQEQMLRMSGGHIFGT
jgi:hypothetical protein